MFAEIHKEMSLVLPFVLSTVGESFVQSPVFRPEGLNLHEFIWVKEGSGAFDVEGDRFVLEKGEGVFIRSGVVHSYRGEPFHTSWVTFTMQNTALDCLGVPLNYLKFEVPPYLNDEAGQLLRFANGKSTVFTRSAAGYSFVVDLFSVILTPRFSPIIRILGFLETCYNEPLGLDDIAKEAGMNRYALCRYFLRERGISVMEELKRIRIAKAKRFLKYSSETAEQVGRMCGFESASYFGKRFRESVGCTPLEYRRRFNENQKTLPG